MDLYELEVENLIKEGGVERLKGQFMGLSRRLDKVSRENKELRRRLKEQTELAEYWHEEADKYEDVLYVKAENSGYYDMTIQRFIELEQIVKEQKEKISELETELSVKEDLLKIKNGLCNEKSVIEILKSTPFVEDALEEEPLPFSDEQYEEDLIEELEDRHQQDCITINQLHTTIDTLVDRYAKLREMRGL